LSPFGDLPGTPPPSATQGGLPGGPLPLQSEGRGTAFNLNAFVKSPLFLLLIGLVVLVYILTGGHPSRVV
jgi:hypothetical protein